ncbi:MAG: hypothetical protein GY797_37290 [Deltaproteobacteria bacterium]|nr:hypothetical protein [Deltaproteobacteria bacterium]
MEFERLIDMIGQYLTIPFQKGLDQTQITQKIVEKITESSPDLKFLQHEKIKIPPNLSILATMNTSDESIFYMDSAFKRRWEWEFVSAEGFHEQEKADELAFDNREEWEEFVRRLNQFIKKHHRVIRKIEDKQIGYYFIKDKPIRKGQIQNKLMFFIWDTVFHRNKKPLANLLNVDEQKLITFSRSKSFKKTLVCSLFFRNLDVRADIVKDENEDGTKKKEKRDEHSGFNR